MAKIKFEDGTVINFNGTPTPQDVEEAYKQVSSQKQTGVSQSADQSALAQMKSRVAADQAAQDLKDEQMRMAIGDTATNVLGKIRDFGQGGTNAVTRTVGGIATLANSALGFTDNPAFVHGTASNKYMLGGVMDDEGAFKSKGVVGNIADVGVNLASLAVPASAGTKAANLMNKGLLATNTGRKLAQSGGVVGKAIPFATEALGQTAAGVAGTMAQEGGYKEGDFGAQLAGNVAAPVLGKFISKAFQAATGRTIANQINKAAQSTDENAIKKVLSTQAGTKFLAKKGIRVDKNGVNMDDVKSVAQKELPGVKDTLLNLPIGQGTKRTTLNNVLSNDTDNGALATFVGNLSEKTNTNNAFDSSETIDNINEYVNKIYSGKRIAEAVTSLGKRQDLPLNNIPLDTLKSSMLGAINNGSLNKDEQLAGRKLIEKYFNKQDLSDIAKGTKSRLEFLNDIRMASNAKYVPEEINARLVLGDEVRKMFDVLLDTADTTKLPPEALNEWRAIKLSNKYFADAQNAKKIAQSINNVSVGGRQGLTRMVGGIVATGGSYNPFAFAAGSIAGDVAHGIINRALNQNIFKHGVFDITDYTGNQLDVLDQLTSHLKPRGEYVSDTMKILKRKDIANPTQLALPAPVKKPVQSLRDELIGTLSKPR